MGLERPCHRPPEDIFRVFSKVVCFPCLHLADQLWPHHALLTAQWQHSLLWEACGQQENVSGSDSQGRRGTACHETMTGVAQMRLGLGSRLQLQSEGCWGQVGGEAAGAALAGGVARAHFGSRTLWRGEVTS